MTEVKEKSTMSTELQSILEELENETTEMTGASIILQRAADTMADPEERVELAEMEFLAKSLSALERRITATHDRLEHLAWSMDAEHVG